jgi:DNA-binding protein HU-beta
VPTATEPEAVPGIFSKVKQPERLMNRQDLIDAIAAQTETSKAATGRLLDTLIQIIQSEVARGGVVKLNGFGTFEKTSAAARTGRHPLTGGPIKIPSTCKPKFTPGTAFKELVKD